MCYVLCTEDQPDAACAGRGAGSPWNCQITAVAREEAEGSAGWGVGVGNTATWEWELLAPSSERPARCALLWAPGADGEEVTAAVVVGAGGSQGYGSCHSLILPSAAQPSSPCAQSLGQVCPVFGGGGPG